MESSKVSETEWEEIVLKSDNAGFCCSPAWAKIIEKSFDDYHTATRLYYINDKTILVPMMEKNPHGFKYFESMPQNYGGFFSESDITTDDFNSIVNDIVGGRNLSFSLSLPPFEYIKPGKSVIKGIWRVNDEENYTHLLRLGGKDFEQIWKNYKQRTRRAIRKSIKSGVEIKEDTSLDDYRAFYQIWTKASKKWGYESVPLPFSFFRNLYKYGSPHVKLSLAFKEKQIIAGNLSLHYNKTIFYYFSAFLPEYGTFNPTSLLLNNLIERSCREDYKYINLGHSFDNEGLIKFKEGFGSGVVEIERYLAWSTVAKAFRTITNVGKI